MRRAGGAEGNAPPGGEEWRGGPDDPASAPSLVWFLAFVLLALVAFRYGDMLLHAQGVLSDWHAYYRAAANLRWGSDIYFEGKLLLARNSYDYWSGTDGQYVYPPLLAFLLVPVTLVLDIGKAGDLWLLILTVAAAGFVLTMLIILGRPLRLETVAPIAVPVLGAVPLLLGVEHGQADIILLLLTTLALLAYLRRREVLAGVALGAAAAVKPTLMLYGLFYLRKRRWVTLGTAAVTGLLLGLGPFALLGSGALADWFAISRYFTGYDFPTYPSNQSMRGFLLRIFAGGPRNTPLLANRSVAEILWVVLVLAALVLWWRCVSGRPERGRRAVAEYALTASLMLFAAPLSEDIHYVALLLPLAVLADRAAWERVSTQWAALAVTGILYFMQPWLNFIYNGGRTNSQRLLLSGAYLYGLVLVGAAIIWWLWHRSVDQETERGSSVEESTTADRAGKPGELSGADACQSL